MCWRCLDRVKERLLSDLGEAHARQREAKAAGLGGVEQMVANTLVEELTREIAKVDARIGLA